jgi:hypothetical protein
MNKFDRLMADWWWAFPLAIFTFALCLLTLNYMLSAPILLARVLAALLFLIVLAALARAVDPSPQQTPSRPKKAKSHGTKTDHHLH